MILAIDIGNTNIASAIFSGKKIISRFSAPKSTLTTAVNIETFFRKVSLQYKLSGVCIASVVPSLDKVFRLTCKKFLGITPIEAYGDTIGIRVRGGHPNKVGADRLVNALAAYSLYHRACIVVDIGTAITFDIVDGDGVFIGGPIAAGPMLMAKALHEQTAKLPFVNTSIGIKKILGRDTIESIQIGIRNACIGLIEYTVNEIKKVLSISPKVILTGGYSPLISRHLNIKATINKDLTLIGIRMAYNKGKSQTSNPKQKPKNIISPSVPLSLFSTRGGSSSGGKGGGSCLCPRFEKGVRGIWFFGFEF